jgi:hypothetical protein
MPLVEMAKATRLALPRMNLPLTVCLRKCLGGLVVVLLTTGPALAADWPQFRGPTGLGYTEEENLPLVWGGPTDTNVLWKSPLSGQGHASPIVWGDRVFVSTARWPENVTEREKVIPEHHVTCYQVTDGRRLWDTQVPPGPWLRTDFRSGPGGGYAAPTPVHGELPFKQRWAVQTIRGSGFASDNSQGWRVEGLGRPLSPRACRRIALGVHAPRCRTF